MNAIKWVNDTFVPFGLKPIEDLPEAVPSQGNSCVIAKILKDGFPELKDVHVGSQRIDFNIIEDDVDAIENVWLKEMLQEDSILYMPQAIQEFIQEFDYGHIPELIDEEQTIAVMGEWGAHETLKIGCTNNKECPFCFPENGQRARYNFINHIIKE